MPRIWTKFVCLSEVGIKFRRKSVLRHFQWKNNLLQREYRWLQRTLIIAHILDLILWDANLTWFLCIYSLWSINISKYLPTYVWDINQYNSTFLKENLSAQQSWSPKPNKCYNIFLLQAVLIHKCWAHTWDGKVSLSKHCRYRMILEYSHTQMSA